MCIFTICPLCPHAHFAHFLSSLLYGGGLDGDDVSMGPFAPLHTYKRRLPPPPLSLPHHVPYPVSAPPPPHSSMLSMWAVMDGMTIHILTHICWFPHCTFSPALHTYLYFYSPLPLPAHVLYIPHVRVMSSSLTSFTTDLLLHNHVFSPSHYS